MDSLNERESGAQPEILLRRVGFDAEGWIVSDLPHNRWLTPGIWHLQRGDERLVMKWLSASKPKGINPFEAHWSANSLTPTRWNYWAREALAYQSGLLERRFGGTDGFELPQVIAIDVTATDAVVLLSFVDGIGAEHWSIDDYGDAARALGAVHARSTAASEPWLSSGFIGDYSSEKPVDWSLLDSDDAWAQPIIAECFPPNLRALAVEVHHRRVELLAVVCRTERAVCHLDFWTKNLIRRADGRTALIDFAFVGDGALGEDIGNLIPDAAFDHFVPAGLLPELETIVIDGYLDGLSHGGWNGDPEAIRRSTWAAGVKYDWLTPLLLERASQGTHHRYGGTEPIDAAFMFKERGQALEFCLGRALRSLDTLPGR